MSTVIHKHGSSLRPDQGLSRGSILGNRKGFPESSFDTRCRLVLPPLPGNPRLAMLWFSGRWAQTSNQRRPLRHFEQLVQFCYVAAGCYHTRGLRHTFQLVHHLVRGFVDVCSVP